MDQKRKIEYTELLENYMQDHNLYDLFQDLISELLIDKPDEPLDYLINKLSKSRNRRLFLTGGTTRVRKEVCKEMAARFGFQHVSVGELLHEEVEKNGKLAREILESWKKGIYVKDSIVLDILFPILEKLENSGKSYILDGAPRTRSQAIALQRAGIIPERLVVLNVSQGFYKSEFLENFSQYAPSDSDFDLTADASYEEYELEMKGVIEEYSWQCHEINSEDNGSIAADAVQKLVVSKGRGKVPRSPPRVLVIGGPLSGKTTMTSLIAKKYGLVLVAISELVEDLISKKTDIGKIAKEYVKNGMPIPEKLLIEMVRERLNSTDCRTNGWILDGFPNTFEQCKALKSLKLVPTNVFFLEVTDNIVYERAKHRKIDPKTGKIFGKEVDEESEFKPLAEDNEENVRNRIFAWREDTIKMHAEFSKIGKSLKGELTIGILFDNISESLETSIQQEINQ